MMRLRADAVVISGRHGPILTLDSLTVRGPALVGILGPNGAGKSTLLRLLAGYRAPGSGTVCWNERPLPLWHDAERGQTCGYMPQHVTPAWDYKLADIVALGAGARGLTPGAAAAALRKFNLDGLAARRWSELSGGEKARAMLAATLAGAPPLVLADEPGASLDMRQRLTLMRALHHHARNGLVIVVMHDLDLALRFCDRLLLLDQGRILADEGAAAMLSHPGFEAAFQLKFQLVPRVPDRDWVLGCA